MAAPTTVGAPWGAGDSADHSSFAIPARTIGAANNLILAFGEVRSASGTNFTSLVPTDGTNTYAKLYGVAPSTNSYSSCYWTLAAGTGPYTITWTPSANGTVASQCREITGTDTTNPIDTSAFTDAISVSGTPITPTALTTTYAGDLAVGAIHTLGSTTSSPLSAQTFSSGSGQVNDTPVEATNAHNCLVGLSEITLGAAGALTFGATIGANVAYACGLVTVNGPRGVTPPTSLKNPSMGFMQRGSTPPPSSQAGFLHGDIVECHWGAQSSQGDSLANAAQPDSGYPNVRTVTDAVLNGTKTVTSASASFNSLDIGSILVGTGIPSGNVIAVINSPTSVTMAPSVATRSATAVSVTISGWGQTIAPAFLNQINSQLGLVRNYNSNIANVRTVTDASVAAGSVTLTSESANFTSADVGKYIVAPGIFPFGSYILSVPAADRANLSNVTNLYGGGMSLTVQIGQSQTLRLRVETGIHSPNWVFALGGGSLTVALGGADAAGKTGAVPQWWKQPVMNAYANFITGLANATVGSGTNTSTVDLCPEIRECLVGLAMLFFGECFIRFPTAVVGSGTNSTVLLGAGLTSQLDFNSMESQIAIHGSAFQNTLTGVDVNPYQNLVGESPAPPASLKGRVFQLGIMDYTIANTHGCFFTNADMNDQSTNNSQLYLDMKNYGPLGTGDPTRNNQAALSFQTYPNIGPSGTNNQYGTLTTLLNRAASFGATSIEIPSSSNLPSPFTQATYQPYDAALQANRPPTPSYWPWDATGGGSMIAFFVNDQSTSSEKALILLLGLQVFSVMDQSTSTEMVLMQSAFSVPYNVSKTVLMGTQQITPFKPL